jgi:hypothetical protein
MRFLEFLAKSTTECGLGCVAYCLMSNHFHLIVATPKPNRSFVHDAARRGA